uniref:Ycf1 n=1 Tax=Apopellia endiviifolia TaxID=304445 RepID=K4JU50_9MARC|nr:Ycf1 [Apopellia endiviifolia]AFU88905.1 Ycf1 [Apopellia endiviifolia]WIA67788.1 Ycf1 [Apopellia endiviifolia]WKW94997.1 Ycf1 [Apopellia endiviifolia]
MILMSQAYVLQRIWGIKTSSKSYLKCLSKSRASHLFLKNNLKIFLYRQGIIGYTVYNFRENDWDKWLKFFNRYNLSPKMWYGIAPREWRFRVSEHWKRDKGKIFDTVQNTNIYQENKEFYVFFADPSLERTRKRNKLVRNNSLTYSYFDSDKNSTTNQFSKLNESRFIGNKDPSGFFVRKTNIFFDYNILLWLIPEFMELHQHRKLFDPKTFVMKDNNRKILGNQELLRERELNQSIRQWRWKSKNLEKKFRKLGNTASLMTFMQNQETMISLSGKMREDLNLFHLFFRRNSSIDQLTTNSEHRLPRLLDDKILMYKMVSILLKFEKRLNKILDLDNGDEYLLLLDTGITKNGEDKSLFLFNSSNLEDILLPKHRREFRILNSLSSLEEGKNKESSNILFSKAKEQNKKIDINKNKIIKRFIWPSYRFEDLACTNRFWFSTINGSRFSMLRFRMYPPI